MPPQKRAVRKDGRRTASGTGNRTVPATTDKDEELKLLSAALLRAMGYYTEISVPLDVDLYSDAFRRHQATDLDVLALRFDGDFGRTRIVVEAKSGTSRAVEELLKIAAVARMFGAQRSWLAKTQIAENARQIAQDMQVLPVDDAELELLLHGHGLRRESVRDAERIVLANELQYRQSLSAQDGFRRIVKYCEGDFWQREYWRNIHNLLAQLARRAENGLNPSEATHSYLVFRVATLTAISVIELAARVVAWSAARPERGVKLFIFGGPSARREREVMFDLVRQTVSTDQLDRGLDPPFLDDLVEVVTALIRNGQRAAEVPACLQDALRRLFLGLPTGAETPAFADAWDPVTLKLAKDLVEFSVKATNTPTALVDAMLRA